MKLYDYHDLSDSRMEVYDIIVFYDSTPST